MEKSSSSEFKLSQARGLVSQLGMFAEENDIPKDLWDALESTIYKFYDVLMIDNNFYRKNKNF